METPGFNSLLAVILASALQSRAEQNVNEDNIREPTPVHFADPNLAVENYLVNCPNYSTSQAFSLATNITVIVDANVYADRIGICTLEPENPGSHQAVGKTTSYTWLAAEPNGPIPGWALSRNKSDYLFSLIDVEVWPITEGQINNDLAYHARIATFGPVDQFDAAWESDAGQRYSTFEPEVGFSWLNRTMGTELSVFSGVTIDQDSSTIDYQSGDVFHVDATMAYRVSVLSGSAGIGVNGYYLKQLAGGTVTYERLGNLDMRAGGLGPVFYYVRDIGKDQFTFEAKWSPRVNIRNTTLGSFFRIEFALIF